MQEPGDATPFLPDRWTLKDLRGAASGCRGCHLWQPATQTVFGEGLKRAWIHQTPKRFEIEACRPWRDDAARAAERAAFAEDLEQVAGALAR